MDIKKFLNDLWFSARVVLDIGSGCGKLAMQCFHRYQNLQRVIGVDISSVRYGKCLTALKLYSKLLRDQLANSPTLKCESVPFESAVLSVYKRTGSLRKKDSGRASRKRPERRLEFYNADIGKLANLIREANPNVVIMDVMTAGHVPQAIARVLYSLTPGTRLATFEQIQDKWPNSIPFPFAKTNIGEGYETTWNSNYHFHLWRRMADPEPEREIKRWNLIQDPLGLGVMELPPPDFSRTREPDGMHGFGCSVDAIATAVRHERDALRARIHERLRLLRASRKASSTS